MTNQFYVFVSSNPYQRIKISKSGVGWLISLPNETRFQHRTNAYSITCLKSDYMIFFKDNIFLSRKKASGTIYNT